VRTGAAVLRGAAVDERRRRGSFPLAGRFPEVGHSRTKKQRIWGLGRVFDCRLLLWFRQVPGEEDEGAAEWMIPVLVHRTPRSPSL
jgi:hypothetical protein